MEDKEIKIYAELESMMMTTAEEGMKACNIDIELMATNLQHCRNLIETLIKIEIDPDSMNALSQLQTTVICQIQILAKKIKQLKNKYPETQKESSVHADEERSNVMNRRRLAIEETLVKSSDVTFDDVAGLNEAKQALREAIIMPIQYPQLFTGGRQPWKRILLYGPPGTGKTRLAQAIASEIKSAFYSVSSADLVSSWVGESEKLIKELFLQATTHQDRSVIFIDEIDSMCRQRSVREEEYTRRIKTELLKQMEGVDNSKPTSNLFLLCATNCPWELDCAFLRRFQRRIYIPLPDRLARLTLLKLHSHDKAISMSDDDWAVLADKTHGYSGSDIAAMTLGALFEPVRQLQTSTHWIASPDGKLRPCDKNCEEAFEATLAELPPQQVEAGNVELSDFIKSLNSHSQTVCSSELLRFDTFTQGFDQHG